MFSKRLRILRENKGYNQEKLANMCGLSTSTIGMYEQGRRQPDNDTLVKLADIFDVSIDYLLGKTEVQKYENPYETELEKILYSKAKDLTPEELRLIINLINTIKRDPDK